MGALDDARAHLAKAREFLDAAEIERDLALYNAATSSAVISGVNSKDAICLVLTGRTSKSDDHLRAVTELREAGRAGVQLAATFQRLLSMKTKSQYQTASIAARDAVLAIERASKLLAGATALVPRDEK